MNSLAVTAVCVFVAAQAHAGEITEAQAFRYELELSRNDKVCRHMQKVYDKDFRQPWAIEPLNKDTYGEHSKYAFPKLPGVEHDGRFTFDMRYSKLPTSPEFDAIKWTEGRYTFGGGPYMSPIEGMIYPFLFANFDINNDGKDNLVIKNRFKGDDHSQNSLVVFERGAIDPSKPHTGWALSGSAADIPEAQFPVGREVPIKFGFKPGVGEITIFWTQIRPFILHDRTYLSIYDLWWWPEGASRPMKKYMRVVEHVGKSSEHIFNGSGALDEARDDMPGFKQICRFRMIPIK